MDQLSSPILLNLSGDYVIPSEGAKPIVGSLSGDLRLAAFDAFLVSLTEALGSGPCTSPSRSTSTRSTANTLVGAIKVALDSCSRTKHSSVTLAITSKLNPESSEIVYSFKVSTQAKDSLFP